MGKPTGKDKVILTGTIGSHSYGTATPTSDYDYMSVVVASDDVYLGLDNWGNSGTKDDQYEDPEKGLVEHKYFELKKAMAMFTNFNPNIIPLLWLQPYHYEVVTPESDLLMKNRTLFNSKQVYRTFSGYAHGQLQKMGGVFNDAEKPNKLLKAGYERFQEWVTRQIELQRMLRDGKLSDVTSEPYQEGFLNALLALNAHAKEECKRIKDGPITGRMGKKRKELREQYGYDCYEESTTEFLTDRGWLKWDNVLATDKLATININTMNTEFQQYTERHDKLYSGPMYTFNGSNYRAVVTTNHHMLVSPVHNRNEDRAYEEKHANWQLTPVSTLLDYEDYNGVKRTNFHYRRATEFKMVLSEFAQMHNDWELRLRLAGFYLSDGCAMFHPNGSVKAVKFTQTKFGNDFQTFLDELAILPEFGANHINRYFYSKEHIWHLYGPIAEWLVDNFGYTDTKHAPSWMMSLSKSEMDAFWEGLIAGDGSRYEKHEVYYSSSKTLADSIQAAFVASGYVIGVSGPYNSETVFGSCSMYQVRKSIFQDKHGILVTSQLNQAKRTDVENVRVVCFSVPNGTLITRNKGKVSIHGNTKFAFHTIRLMRMCNEFLARPEEGLKVYRQGIDADFLYSIREGKFTQEEVKVMADELFAKAKELVKTTDLPEEPDSEKIHALTIDIIRMSL
jgi:predicted nucleotidyltransferase